VSETRGNKPSVATSCTIRNSGALDENDVTIGVDIVRQQRGPQTGETATDNHEIGIYVLGQQRLSVGTLWVVEPKDRALGF
jgi:hypothetical protein